MADGDNAAGGMGMGMIIGLLMVLILVIGGGFYLFGGRGGGSSPANPAAAVGQATDSATHTVSGTVQVK
ncbi:MAG: hypothetical protein JWO72_1873 [Caulobacteraceae bacterium]|nr:hypothetical protein [Caulobacteraceae bacterium]